MYTWSATAKILKQLHLIDGLHGIVAKNLIWKFALEGCSICLERFTQLVEKQHFLPAKNAHRVFSSVTPRASLSNKLRKCHHPRGTSWCCSFISEFQPNHSN